MESFGISMDHHSRGQLSGVMQDYVIDYNFAMLTPEYCSTASYQLQLSLDSLLAAIEIILKSESEDGH